MIAEFVERRGGGLLMLGGARSFSEGGYAGTPVADALPVQLDRVTRSLDTWSVSRVKVRPTRAGEGHALAQIAPTEAASLNRWNDLPTLISVNTIKGVKPGATVLLTGTDEKRATQPVLAFQRYGRGKALAFTVLDSWRWQMHAQHPARGHDPREPTGVSCCAGSSTAFQAPVEVHTSAERVEAGEQVVISADVVDDTFVEINDAQVLGKVTGPGGGSSTCRCNGPASGTASIAGRSCRARQGMYAVESRGLSGRQGPRRGSDHSCERRRAMPSTSMRRCTPRGSADRRRDRRPLLHAGDDEKRSPKT